MGNPSIQIDQARTFSMRYEAYGQRITTQAQAQAALTDLGNVGTGQDFGVSSAMFGTFAEDLHPAGGIMGSRSGQFMATTAPWQWQRPGRRVEVVDAVRC